MQYVKGKATVEVKPSKERRLIGQCKSCEWFDTSMPISCEHSNEIVYQTNAEFGCWYWREDGNGKIKR